MANKNSDTQTKTDKPKSNTTDIKALEEKIQSQQEQIEKLMEMLSQSVNISSTPNNKDNDISADEEIEIISLTPNRLNIIGEGGSILVSFDKMYEEQLVDYASLKDALRIRVNREMAKKGRFYINDERVVNKLRLKNDYKNILSPEQLQHLLAIDVSKAIELYKLAPKGQKSAIIEIVKQSKFNGDNIDYNLLNELTKLSGVDLVNVEDVTKIEVK
ncbi:MAG: hypothetical protein IKR19_02610 [Acholeplasmatales bacterium]|nr:hypothetical protein [Acholeplasmatales bacterium]